MKIAICVTETSGEDLALELVEKLRAKDETIEFVGVFSDKMRDLGCKQIIDYKKFSVIGLLEIIPNIIKILYYFYHIYYSILKEKPDLFIGIDSPDFNLPLARRLKKTGIKTIQYVSPSVWAWRRSRVKTVCSSVNRLLTLYRFEKSYYKNLDVKHVGHGLREKLAFTKGKNNKVVIMPGSRVSEIKTMLPIYLEVVGKLVESCSNVVFYMPLTSVEHKELALSMLPDGLKDNIILSVGNYKEVIEESGSGIITSGTATLAAALANLPHVCCYKMNYFTHKILQKMVSSKYIALPNILSNEYIVPELIQENCNVDKIYEEIYGIITSTSKQNMMSEGFKRVMKEIEPTDELVDSVLGWQ